FASASLMQGQIVGSVTDSLRQKLPKELETDAQLGLHFVRSTPGVTSALVGMKQIEHVKENLKTAAVPPLTNKEFQTLIT
ncbi:aldo/keto reductase, partial [Bdellovibrionota bacterium]